MRLRTRTQELETGLVADLHAAAGQQRDAPAQSGQLGALREVDVAAGRAQAIVEVMNASSTAACRCSNTAGRPSRGRGRPSPVPVSRRQGQGRAAETLAARKTFGVVNTGWPPQHADAGRGEHAIVAVGLFPPPPARRAPSPSCGGRERQDCRRALPPARRRRCSSSERTASVPRSAAISSSVSVAARRRSRSCASAERVQSVGHAPQA